MSAAAVSCSYCHYWRQFIVGMARLDPSWAGRSVPSHSCVAEATSHA